MTHITIEKEKLEPVGYITQARCFVHLHECTDAEAKLYGWKTIYTTLPAAQLAPVQEPVVWPRPEDQPIDNGPDYEDGPDEEGFSGPRPWNGFAQPAPVQEPVAWVTVEDGKCISTRSADFRHIADGQYQLYVGPLAYEVPAAIKTLEALGYIYEEGEQWTAPPAAQPAPVADFDDPLVQTVYNILCDADEGKPREDHWEGWKARRIVATLTTPQTQPAPVQEPVACHICGGSGFVKCNALQSREKNNGKWGRCLRCQPYTTPPAHPAVPDALNPKNENPAYAAGWNDCRAEMLKGMKS